MLNTSLHANNNGLSMRTQSCSCVKNKKNSLPRLDKKFLLSRITSELMAADGSCEPTLNATLPELWEIVSVINGCNPMIAYYNTKLQALHNLMGCYIREVDTMREKGETNAGSRTKKDENVESQSQSTSSTLNFSDAIGNNRFDDKANMLMTYHSETIGRGWSYDYGEFNMDDKGYSTSHSDSETKGTVRNYKFSLNTSDTTGENEASGANVSCKSQTSFKKSKSQAQPLFIGAASSSGSRGGGTKFQKDSSGSYRKGFRNGDTVRYINGWVKNKTETDGKNNSWSQALVDELGWTRGAFDQWSKSKSHRQMNAHAEGYGHSQDEMKAKNTGASQGTSETKKILTALVTSNRNGYMVMDDVKSSQKFKHLSTIYDNTLLDLKNYERFYKANVGYAADKLHVKWLSECNFMPEMKATKCNICGCAC